MSLINYDIKDIFGGGIRISISLHDKNKCKKEPFLSSGFFRSYIPSILFSLPYFISIFLMVWNSNNLFRNKWQCLQIVFDCTLSTYYLSSDDICSFHIVEIFHVCKIRYKMKLNVHVIAICKQVWQLNPVFAVAFNYFSDFLDNCLSPRPSLMGQIFCIYGVLCKMSHKIPNIP